MASADSSPSSGRFGGSMSAELDFLSSAAFDPSFTAEISNKMRVPKKIRVAGGHEHENGGGADRANGNEDFSWNRRRDDKVQMQVPDRIMVTGQEKHVGGKALPRELQLETVVMPPDPEIIRIQTPPRSITLQNVGSQLSSRPESSAEASYRSEEDDETLVVETGRFDQGGIIMNGSAVMGYGGGIGISTSARGSGGDDSVAIPRRSQRVFRGGEEIDELDHLREQLSRMNRRLLAVEEDTAERKERERYLVLAGLIYLAYKTCTWLFKAGPSHH